jgi:hypothetical protein
MQAASLRSQPDLINDPQKVLLDEKDHEMFGFLYKFTRKSFCWKVEFEVMHEAVYDDGFNELGHLYRDCDNVPMSICGTECVELKTFIDCSAELRNIYFVKY